MLCCVTSLIYFSLVCVMIIHRVMSHIFRIYQLLNVLTAQTVSGSRSVVADDAVPSGSGTASCGDLRSVITAPPSDQKPRDVAASASGMRKGMLSITSHSSLCIWSTFGLLFYSLVLIMSVSMLHDQFWSCEASKIAYEASYSRFR